MVQHVRHITRQRRVYIEPLVQREDIGARPDLVIIHALFPEVRDGGAQQLALVLTDHLSRQKVDPSECAPPVDGRLAERDSGSQVLFFF